MSKCKKIKVQIKYYDIVAMIFDSDSDYKGKTKHILSTITPSIYLTVSIAR